LLRLTRRISYNCPIEYISDPFYILYAQYRDKVHELFGQKNTSDESDPIEALKRDFDLSEISTYIFQDIEYINFPEGYDKLRELPNIVTMPYNITANPGQNGLPFLVERLKSGIDWSKISDEFADNKKTDLLSILTKIFLLDGRIYKHYRLLPWFP
jgi:hypothetical protein